MQKDHGDRAIGPAATAVAVIALLAPGPVDAQALDISRGGSRVVREAPSGNFTGLASVDMIFGALHSSDATGGSVAFEPGARTAWHSHPGGQTLIVTAGTGRVQRWGDDVQEIRSGDVVRIAPGQKHWHGAAPQTAMTHIAITEPRGGTAVEWMEPVSDEQFHAPPATTQPPAASRPSGALQQRLAPGLASLTDDVLYGDVWRRPELSPRDRSLVTIAILIATGRTAQLAGHLSRGFDNGLQPRETSGVLAHLAIYSGWPSAVSALQVYEQVYAARKVDTAALREVGPRLPALPASAGRPPALDPSVAAVAPKFAQLTADVVIGDLWRRPDLATRDRSLVTIAALAAMGDDDQLDVYVRRGLESGLTRAEIAEAVTHLAFYAGWGKASTAMVALARAPQEASR
jgi:4-carboxymuconolactone decarboxylase